MKLTGLCCIAGLLVANAGQIKQTPQVKEENIAGISVQILFENLSSFKTQFITVSIRDEDYSKDNLISVWRYYCEKYTDKRNKLDLRVYIDRSYKFNRQFNGWPEDVHTGEAIGPNGSRVKLRSYEAIFLRTGKGLLAYGGDNELMIYSPNIDEPDRTVRIVLAGEDPIK